MPSKVEVFKKGRRTVPCASLCICCNANAEMLNDTDAVPVLMGSNVLKLPC